MIRVNCTSMKRRYLVNAALTSLKKLKVDRGEWVKTGRALMDTVDESPITRRGTGVFCPYAMERIPLDFTGTLFILSPRKHREIWYNKGRATIFSYGEGFPSIYSFDEEKMVPRKITPSDTVIIRKRLTV